MAKSEILDRSESYLNIFVGDNIDIDYSLPKYERLREKKKKNGGIESGTEYKYSTPAFTYGDGDSNTERLREISRGEDNQKLVDAEFFNNLDPQDLAILIDETRKGKYFVNDVWEVSVHPTPVPIPLDGENAPDASIGEPVRRYGKLMEKIQRALAIFREEDVGEKLKEKPLYEWDILKFFMEVKALGKEQLIQYVNRITPIMKAIKDAEEMGQTALVDKYLALIFLNKYESFLYASGYNTRISEEQMVEFVKKTEKGVSLDYLKNYGRPIPESVRETKKRADELCVFDNYVVLYYDPDGKIYTRTAEEQKRERQKKADPILFGIINGYHHLYYITDWIDEWCDLTLEKFIETSGISEEALKIEDKIQIRLK